MNKDAPSPHHSSRGGREVVGTVIHYTAGGYASGTVRWFSMEQSRVSAHFVIGRKGEVWQCVELDRAAWHAGRGTIDYKGQPYTNPNKCTVGIELANRGPLERHNDRWVYEFGRKLKDYRGPEPVWASGFVGRKKVDGYWEPYRKEQLEALKGVISYIRNELGDEAVRLFGHHEIAPARKIDPGPHFPWNDFRKGKS